MVFSAFTAAAALAQAPVASAPATPAVNQAGTTAEQHLQCLTFALLMTNPDGDETLFRSLRTVTAYYYGRLDALVPGSDIVSHVRRLMPQQEMLKRESKRCMKEIVWLAVRLNSDAFDLGFQVTPSKK